MKLDIIVGATWGEEGKSKFARYYSDNVVRYDGVIKIGGYCTNNFYDRVTQKMMHCEMLPAGSGYANEVIYYFPKDCFVDIALLKQEMEMRSIAQDHVVIDPEAYIIYPDESIGYPDDTKIHFPCIIADVMEMIVKARDNAMFLVEGQGGYGLAKEIYQLYENHMPMLIPTMTASGICHLLRIAPTDVDDVILVSTLESYKKKNFLSLNKIHPFSDFMQGKYERGNYFYKIDSPDTTPYNVALVREAIIANDPSILVVNGLDEVDNGNVSAKEMTPRQSDMVKWIEAQLGSTIDYIGYGEKEIAELKNESSFESLVQDNAEDVFNLLEKYNLNEGDTVSPEFMESLQDPSRHVKPMIPTSRVPKGGQE